MTMQRKSEEPQPWTVHVGPVVGSSVDQGAVDAGAADYVGEALSHTTQLSATT